MIKESMVLTFSKAIRGILMLIFNMIISRLFSQSLYGTYKHINLIVNLFTTICTLGIPTTISYYYPIYNKDNKNKLISNTIVVLFLISSISSISIILFRNQLIEILNNPDILKYISILAIYVSVMIMSSFLENLYISSGKSIMMGKIYIVYVIINFIIMTINIVVFKSLYLMVVFMALIEVIRTIVMYSIIKYLEKLHFNINLSMMINQIKFAIPLGIVSIVQTINMYIDNLFISSNYTPSQYAAYANAAMDIPFVSIITVSVAAVILPRISKVYKQTGDFKKVIYIWGDSCKKTAIIMFPIFWIAMFFSVGYIQLIFSEKYIQQSTPIFMIYLIKFPLYCTVYGNILLVLKKQKCIMYDSILGVVLNIILNLLFLNLFGMVGPAISTVLVQYIVVVLQLIQISNYTKVRFIKLMPFKKLIALFILPAFIAIPVFGVSLLINIPKWLELIIFGSIIYLISLIIYYKFKYIDSDVISFIKSDKI